MKTEKIQLRDNNSLCAEVFQLLRSRAPAQINPLNTKRICFI
jgi:hypothetical protein